MEEPLDRNGLKLTVSFLMISTAYVQEFSLLVLFGFGSTCLAFDSAFQTTIAMITSEPRAITAAPVIAPATIPVVK